MGLYHRGKIFCFTIMQDGRRIQVSTATDNKRSAEKIYGKTLFELQENRWFENQAKKKPLREMIERFEKEHTDHRDYYPKARDKSIYKKLYGFFGEDATLQEVENLIGSYEYHRKVQGHKDD